MCEPTADSTFIEPVAGRDYPVDIAQLRAWFPGDDACMDYLDWLRWPQGSVCPRCGSSSAGRDEIGRYRCHGCRRRVSVTAGTIFDKTRIPMTVWFEAIWLFTAGKSGISALYLHRVLPIGSYQTAWTMLSKLRQVMSSAESEPLRGTVEMDETFLGGPRHGKVGRAAAGKTLVAGALEILPDGWGRARLGVIPDASAASFKASGHPAHKSLPAVHRLFALVKRSLEGTYQGSWGVEHLPQYLDEFVFRFNRRHSRSRGLVFMRLLQRAAASGRVTYRDLALVSKHKRVHPTGALGARARPGTLDIDSPPRPWRHNP